MTRTAMGLALVTALAVGAPVIAKPSVSQAATLGSRACLLTDITDPASACSGWYEGNLNGGSPAKIADQIFGLNELFPVSDPFNVGNFLILGKIETDDDDNVVGDGTFFANGSGGFTVDFDKLLFGDTIVSFHVGGAVGQSNGIGYNATAFFLFDAGDTGLDTFTLNIAGLSNATLYATEKDPRCVGDDCGGPIPEPDAWALMIMGFGAAGAVLRRRRTFAA